MGPILILLASLFLFPVNLLADVSWQKEAAPFAAQDLVSLCRHPVFPDRLLVASETALYEQQPSGNWKFLWHPSGPAKIHRILTFAGVPDSLFVLTSDGAFEGRIQENTWRQIYRAASPGEKPVLSFTLLPQDPEHWFLGTARSLWESDDAGRNWYRFSQFRRDSIPLLSFGAGKLFTATPERVYRSDDLSHFTPVFSLLSGDAPEFLELEEDLDASGDTAEDAPGLPEFFDFESSGTPAGKLWLGSELGAYESSDGGRTWQSLSRSGLRKPRIFRLLYAPESGRLFAGTRQGIYRYDTSKSRWSELYQGLDASGIQDLLLFHEHGRETLAAITRSGLYFRPLLPDGVQAAVWSPSPDRSELFRELVRLEPGIREIQKEAIRYADVGNGKIKRWHAESRLKTLLPDVSFGKDYSRGNNIDLDRGSTSDPDRYIFGPDDVNRGWDLSVSWDLGDFIWSSAQTSIDSREKLTVEFRNDILAELTRLYYERRRLQMEIVFSPQTGAGEHFEKLIRMDELTALIDAMTGGYLSEKLSAVYQARPDLKELWSWEDISQGGETFQKPQMITSAS